MIDATIGMIVVASIVTYFVCGIPFGLLVAAKDSNIDIRKAGSGNIGTTNVARTLGAKAGLITLILDALKGFLSTYVWIHIFSAVCFAGDSALVAASGPFGWMGSVVFLAAVLGHVFSPYLHFHGGKGIAVGFGAALGFAPGIALGLAVVFLAAALPTRYVSLGSCLAAASLPFWAYVLGAAPATIAPLVAISALVLWAHRANISRLAAGKERKFSFHRAGGDTQ